VYISPFDHSSEDQPILDPLTDSDEWEAMARRHEHMQW
jgi:hypothetical protein